MRLLVWPPKATGGDLGVLMTPCFSRPLLLDSELSEGDSSLYSHHLEPDLIINGHRYPPPFIARNRDTQN